MKNLDLAVMEEMQAQQTILIINRTQAKKVSMPKETFEEKMAISGNGRWSKTKWEFDILQIEASRNGVHHG